MASNKSTKQKPSVTPAGTLIYPHFHAPDTKFDADGVYRGKLKLAIEEGQPLIDTIEAAIKHQLNEAGREFAEDPRNKGKKWSNSKLSKLADKPYSIGEAEDEGFVFFNFKMKASGKKKDSDERWTRKLALFDARRQPLAAGAKVGGGSLAKIAYTLNPFSTAIGTGVSLRLESAQILELREFSRDGASFGFEEEEGFAVNETEATETEETETAGATEGADF